MNEKVLKSLFDIKIAIHEIVSFLPAGKLSLSQYNSNLMLKKELLKETWKLSVKQ